MEHLPGCVCGLQVSLNVWMESDRWNTHVFKDRQLTLLKPFSNRGWPEIPPNPKDDFLSGRTRWLVRIIAMVGSLVSWASHQNGRADLSTCHFLKWGHQVILYLNRWFVRIFFMILMCATSLLHGHYRGHIDDSLNVRKICGYHICRPCMPSTLGQIREALMVDNLQFLQFMMFWHQEFDVVLVKQPLLERSDMFGLWIYDSRKKVFNDLSRTSWYRIGIGFFLHVGLLAITGTWTASTKKTSWLGLWRCITLTHRIRWKDPCWYIAFLVPSSLN